MSHICHLKFLVAALIEQKFLNNILFYTAYWKYYHFNRSIHEIVDELFYIFHINSSKRAMYFKFSAISVLN